MHEILPLVSTAPLALSSPVVLGELSRRLPSELAVQNLLPASTGLVGNSRMWLFPAPSAEFLSPAALTGLRNTSMTRCLVTTTIALRSLAEVQILPSRSSAMPSAPSRYGCAARMLSRHTVL